MWSNLSCVKPLEKCTEYDDTIRNCSLNLYTRPVLNQHSIFTNTDKKRLDDTEPVGNSQNSDGNEEGETTVSNANGSNQVYFHHWALVADFGPDNRQLTFEAGDDGSGHIQATRTEGVMADATDAFIIGTVETSPKKLLELAKKHPFNGTMYLHVFRNCQNWVKEFAKMIDPNLLTKLENIDSCDKAIIKQGALAVSSAKLFTSSMILNHFRNEEHDDKLRNCYIKLYTRPVTQSASSNANEANPILHHWALVADFGPKDRQLMFEAGDDGNGYIKATRTQGVLRNATDAFFIGTTQTSPKKLWELAKKNPLNGQNYLPALQNCQDWVKEFAKTIDPDLFDKLKDIDSCDKAVIIKGLFSRTFTFTNSNNTV